MLLVFLTASSVCFGLSAGLLINNHEVCYGGTFTLPSTFSPPLYNGTLYLTPSNGGSRRLLLDDGKAKDPRLKISTHSTYLSDLTERDDGTLSVSFGGDETHNIGKLKILDCATEVRQEYGSRYDHRIRSGTAFLEFTPLDSLDQPKIMWNRTDPQSNRKGRGRVRDNRWEISGLTQSDNGYYNFRRKDNSITSRLLVEVKERVTSHHVDVNKALYLEYPVYGVEWTVTFRRLADSFNSQLVRAGHLYLGDGSFDGRIKVMRHGIEIDPLESTDSGNYEFLDPQGNLGMTANVSVNDEVDPFFKVLGIAAGIVAVLILLACCFCRKKKCCKKGRSAPQTSAAPAVYYYDDNQPTGPSYSAAPSSSSLPHRPVNSQASTRPANTSHELPTYLQASAHVNQSQVAPPQSEGSVPAPTFGSDLLSSGHEPKFELKGFGSALPLSSESNTCDVYNSSKLNFL